MRLLLTIIVVAALGVGGSLLWKQWDKKQGDSPDSNPVSTALVESRDISFVITAAGEIGPADQVSVRPEVNGRIAELPVDLGDQVKKGQLLCRLDDQDLQIERESRVSEIAGTKLQIEAAEIRVRKMEREFKRNQELSENHLISEEIFENSRTDLQLAKNQIELSRNALERASQSLKLLEDRISKTRIAAPFDCTVLTRPVSLGQTVSGAAGFNSGTEVMTIANLNDMIITAHINQADVTRMKAGQRVDVQIESVPGLQLHGVVERIAPQAIIKNGMKGFAARVTIKDLDPRIRPGMTSILSIPVASVENALSVPLSAVFTENGERFVYVKQDESYEKRNVQIGISDFAYAEVQKGLREGEVVALELPREIKPASDTKAANLAGKAMEAAGTIGGARPAVEKSGTKKAVM